MGFAKPVEAPDSTENGQGCYVFSLPVSSGLFYKVTIVQQTFQRLY